VGLVPFVAHAGEELNSDLHELAQPSEADLTGAKVRETVATGFRYQGQLARKALVVIETQVGNEPPAAVIEESPEPPTPVAEPEPTLEPEPEREPEREREPEPEVEPQLNAPVEVDPEAERAGDREARRDPWATPTVVPEVAEEEKVEPEPERQRPPKPDWWGRDDDDRA
jgi:hypothetical protein